MENIDTLLKLPFETLALMSAGYVSYRIAYTAKDGTHEPIDTVFLTLVFAFIAKLAMALASAISALFVTQVYTFTSYPITFAILGFLVAVGSAAIWRRWGEEILFNFLRKLKVSSVDRHETVWQSMIARPRAKGPTRLYIKCSDGSKLLCEKLSDFQNSPYGPCLFGQDGSVALYVSHRITAGGQEWEIDQTASGDTEWGNELTFVPASEILEVRINFPTTPLVLVEVE